MRRALPILTILLALLGSPAQAEIVIGLAAPLQGASATLGEQMRHGAQQAIDDINSAGGVRGELLALRAEDDACDPRKAVDVANRFVSDGVKFVVGHYCSGSSIPASRVYASAGILQISPASSLAKFTDEGDWNVFRTAQRDDAQGAFAGRFLATAYKDAGIAILSDQSPSNTAIAARAKDALNGAGVKEVLFEGYTAGGGSYTELSGRIAAAGAGVVYLAGAYPEAVTILRDLNERGFEVQLVSDDALVTDEFWNQAGDLAEGTLMSFLPDPLKIVTAQGVIAKLKDKGFTAEGHAINAYAAVQLLVRAMDATQGTDPRSMAGWLRSGSRISTVLGDIAFDAKGDLADQKFIWLRWSKGKYVEAEDLNPKP